MTPCPLDAWTAQRLHGAARPLERADVAAYQDRALQELLAYCQKHATFYRRKWAGLDLGRIKGMADMHHLPCTSEAELCQYGQEMLCVGQDAVARIMSLRSSGSTGPAKRLFFTEEDLERTRDFFHHGMLHMLHPGSRVAIFLPGESPDSTGALLAEALQRVPAASRTFGMVQDMAASARQLAAWQPTVLVGLPVQMLACARMAHSLGCWPAGLSAVLLCSDYIPHSIATALAAQFGCEVFSHYGSVESGLGAAVDCSAHSGLHVRESDVFFEILDGNLQSQATGAWGEIVLTTLSRRGMPLVRYRSGDMGRLLPGTCPCGSVLARLDQVRGRIQGQLLLQDGARLSLGELDEVLFPLPGLLDFQAGLARSPSGAEELRLHLNILPGRGQECMQQIQAILTRISALQNLTVQLDCCSNSELLHGGKRQLSDYRENMKYENVN